MTSSRFNPANLKQRDWAIVFIVLSLIGAGLWYWYMYRPTQENITLLEDEITRLNTQIERGEAARNNLPTLRLAVAELEQDRREFLAELPPASEVADLIDGLRVSASDADLEIDSIGQGGGGEDVQDVRPIGFSLATSGTYGETMAFLATLETMQRFTKIQQVSLSTGEAVDDPALSANFGFTVYVFTGEDPGGPEVQP